MTSLDDPTPFRTIPIVRCSMLYLSSAPPQVFPWMRVSTRIPPRNLATEEQFALTLKGNGRRIPAPKMRTLKEGNENKGSRNKRVRRILRNRDKAQDVHLTDI